MHVSHVGQLFLLNIVYPLYLLNAAIMRVFATRSREMDRPPLTKETNVFHSMNMSIMEWWKRGNNFFRGGE